MDLEHEVYQLAIARMAVAEATTTVKKRTEDLEQTETWMQLDLAREWLAQRKENMKHLERRVRELAVTLHYQGQDPHPDVKIVQANKYGYTHSDAIEWAADTKQFQLLKLNAAAFKKVASNLALTFVTHEMEAQARISSKLPLPPTGGDDDE
jgi:uncharacterized protein (DUF2344 family)